MVKTLKNQMAVGFACQFLPFLGAIDSALPSSAPLFFLTFEGASCSHIFHKESKIA